MIAIYKDTIYKIRNHSCLIIVHNHPTSLRQDQSVAVATTNFTETKKRKTKKDNVTKPTLYAYVWDPNRLVRVGHDYRLYYFIKFIQVTSK